MCSDGRPLWARHRPAKQPAIDQTRLTPTDLSRGSSKKCKAALWQLVSRWPASPHPRSRWPTAAPARHQRPPPATRRCSPPAAAAAGRAARRPPLQRPARPPGPALGGERSRHMQVLGVSAVQAREASANRVSRQHSRWAADGSPRHDRWFSRPRIARQLRLLHPPGPPSQGPPTWPSKKCYAGQASQAARKSERLHAHGSSVRMHACSECACCRTFMTRPSATVSWYRLSWAHTL